MINCAAFTNVDNAENIPSIVHEVNVEGVRNLSFACKKYNSIMIQISSDYVYNSDLDPVYDEDSVCDPAGVYAKSKFDGEEIVRSILESHFILRASWVYSSFGHNFVKTMIRLGSERENLKIVNDQIGSPTYAGDLALTIVKIIEECTSGNDLTKFGTYNYSNLGFVSWAEFGKEIFTIKKINTKVIEIPSSEYPTIASRPLNSRMSKSKIADTFSINLIHWKKSLRKCIQEIDNSFSD